VAVKPNYMDKEVLRLHQVVNRLEDALRSCITVEGSVGMKNLGFAKVRFQAINRTVEQALMREAYEES
jgi:hypothetical protein